MKKILICLYLILLTLAANSQSKYFGDEFFDWVNTDANKASQELIESNWSKYWNSYFIALQTDVHDIIKKIDPELKIYYSNLEKFEDHNDLLSDDVIKAINRKKNSLDQTDKLIEFGNLIEQCQSKLLAIDTLGSKQHFVRNGFYHSGRTTLLESFSEMANGLSNFNESYGVAVVVTTNGNETSITDVNYEGNDELRATLYTASAIAANYPPYGFIVTVGLSAVTGIMAINDRKEYEKQINKLTKAFKLLPKRILNEEQAYNIYKVAFEKKRVKYSELNSQTKSLLADYEDIIKELLTHNALKIKLSESILTTEKVKELTKEYEDGNRATTSLFNNVAIIKVSTDISRLSEEQTFLKYAIYSQLEGFDKLNMSEKYYDALIENNAVLKSYRSNTDFLPFWTILDEKIKINKEELNKFKKLKYESTDSINNEKEDVLFGANYYRIQNTAITSLLNQNKINYDSIKAEHILYYLDALPIHYNTYSEINIQRESLDIEFAYINRSGHPSSPTFNISIGSPTNNDYRNNFFRDGHFTDLSNSIFDGGFNSDLRFPTYDVAQMVKNISERIDMLKVNDISLEEQFIKWKNQNSQQIIKLSKDNTNLKKMIENRNNSFYDVNNEILEKYKKDFDYFLSNKLNADYFDNYFNTLDVAGDVLYSCSPKHIRPSGANLSLLDFRDRFFRGMELLQREVAHEEYKNNDDFDTAYKRFKKNNSNRVSDPVFGTSFKKLAETKKLADMFIDAARICSDPSSKFYQEYREVSHEMCRNFLDNATKIRYYSLGLLPSYNLDEKLFFNVEEIREHLKSNAHNYKSCSPEGDLSFSACNRFVARYLKDVFKVDDFWNNPNGMDLDNTTGITFLNTYQIAPFVEESEDWALLGSALNETTQTLAGLYAGMKYPVIAIKPGHISIILPGLPTTFSGKWGMNVVHILNFSLVNRGQEPNIKLNVPISEAWKKKDAAEVLIYYRKM